SFSPIVIFITSELSRFFSRALSILVSSSTELSKRTDLKLKGSRDLKFLCHIPFLNTLPSSFQKRDTWLEERKRFCALALLVAYETNVKFYSRFVIFLFFRL